MRPGQGAPPVLHLRRVVGRVGGRGGFEIVIENFDVARGEAIALAGPSGSGKSTALNLLALALRPAEAEIFLMYTRAGETLDIGALWRKDDDDSLTTIRARAQGYVLQQGGLLPFLSVRQNIGLSQRIIRRYDVDYLKAVADRLQIGELLDRPPATLSVGQRQRVAIARALVHQPDIVLADEPTASVHPVLADEILSLLVQLAWETETTIIASTHDPDRAVQAGFRVVNLAGGGHGASGERSILSCQPEEGAVS